MVEQHRAPSLKAQSCNTGVALPIEPLAEDLDAQLLAQAFDAEIDRIIRPQSNLHESERQYRLGCLCLEQGLVRATDQKPADNFMTKAQDHFDQGLEIEDSGPHITFKTAFISAFMPFFRERKTMVEATDDAIQQLCYDLGALAANTNAYESKADVQVGMLTKVGVPLFLARKKVRVYGGTFRESNDIRMGENTGSQALTHVSYTIPDGSRLLIRATHKRQERKEPKSQTIIPVPFGEFIRSKIEVLFPGHIPSSVPNSETTRWVMDIAIRESRGDKPKPEEANLLDGVSSAIQKRLSQYRVAK